MKDNMLGIIDAAKDRMSRILVPNLTTVGSRTTRTIYQPAPNRGILYPAGNRVACSFERDERATDKAEPNWCDR